MQKLISTVNKAENHVTFCSNFVPDFGQRRRSKKNVHSFLNSQ